MPSDQVSHTIAGAAALGLTGEHTAQVSHCNEAGGCSEDGLAITFTLPYKFEPYPMALGDTSGFWSIPVDSPYLDVDFSASSAKDSQSGGVRIIWFDTDFNEGTLLVDAEGDSDPLPLATGSLIMLHVEVDAFDASAATVTLNFHSGTNTSGPLLATAKVQKEARPNQPVGGTWSSDKSNDSVTLTWNKGSVPAGANPAHYEILISDENANALYSQKVDDPEGSVPLDEVSHTIAAASSYALVGEHTAEVRHCNAVGGCSLQALEITFTHEPYHAFTPDPLPLGGNTGRWTVPDGTTSVFVDLVFPEHAGEKDQGSGDIEINWLDLSKTTYTISVDDQDDDAVLSAVAAGYEIWIHAEEDAFYSGGGLIVLNFHSGRDNTGTLLAKATIQKEARPETPIDGSVVIDPNGGHIRLEWRYGDDRSGAIPDHYEVIIPNPVSDALGDPQPHLFEDLNVDDSNPTTTLEITDPNSLAIAGVHTAEIRHCNSAGGCSGTLRIYFHVPDGIAIGAPTNKVDKGKDIAFRVYVWDLAPSTTYQIEVSSSGANAAFSNDCNTLSRTAPVITTVDSFNRGFTLYGCHVGNATVTASLTGGTSTKEADQFFSVTCAQVSQPVISVSNDKENIEAEVKGLDPNCYYQLTLARWDGSANPQVGSPQTPAVDGTYSLRPPNGGDYKVALQVCNDAALADCKNRVFSKDGPIHKLYRPTGFNLILDANDQRRATLDWADSPSATGYDVDELPGTPDPVVRVPIPVDSHLALDLDAYLMEHDFYQFRVRATGPMTVLNSDFSRLITIVDTPITFASGKSPAGMGEADLKWNAVTGAVGGEYAVRYLRLNSPTTWINEIAWTPVRMGDRQTVVDWDSDQELIVRGLSEGTDIYGFQLVYGTPSVDPIGVVSVDAWVFSARDTYVWSSSGFPERDPSSDHPLDYERIATYAFFGHHPNRTYNYEVCGSPYLDEGNRFNEWVTLIEATMEVWETATQIVSTNRVPSECRSLEQQLHAWNLILQDEQNSEIRVIDETIWPEDDFIIRFPEMASDIYKGCLIGATACVTSIIGYGDLDREAGKALVDENGFPVGVDISVKQSFLDANDFSVPTNVRFNQCLPTGKKYPLYELILHEVGHALGLSNADTYRNYANTPGGRLLTETEIYYISHPTIADSAMNYNDLPTRPTQTTDEPDCSPHPLDIMAIYALYQNVP